MYFIDAVNRNYETRKRIFSQIPEGTSLVKMYDQDSAFICGLLEKSKPRKILEVGIANGGTSAIILECMYELGLSCELHCVDKMEKGYMGVDREIGFLGKEAARLLGFDNYHLWKGVVLPQVIDKIGPGIDFLILDTTHILPGETLDFLIAYPYLSQNAFVCLHDIRQNQKNPPDQKRIGTNALFNCIAADKYVDSDAERTPDYPNIGAFQVNADTKKYITNVFGALTMNWQYSLSEKEYSDYSGIIRRHYPEEARWLFDHAVIMNRLSLSHSLKKKTIPVWAARQKERVKKLLTRR